MWSLMWPICAVLQIIIVIAVYVDNLLVTGNDLVQIECETVSCNKICTQRLRRI